MGLMTRGIVEDVKVRGINEENRTATFVAATENGVRVFGDEVEHLRMDGADLTRYRKNPVVVDSHDIYSSATKVVGRADVSVDGQKLLAEVQFADTDLAEQVWRLVKGGFVRMLSVGYQPDPEQTERLSDGQESEGVRGPASIVRAWELHEISVVPVGADPDALLRYMAHRYERSGRMPFDEEHMDDEERVAEDGGDDKGEEGAEGNGEIARDLIAEAEEKGFEIEDIAAATDRDPGVVSAIKAGEIENPPTDFLEKLRDLIASGDTETEADEDDDRGAMTDEEEEARALAAKKKKILAITPNDLRSYAEGLILNDPSITFEAARERIKEEWTNRSRPAGTQDIEAEKARARATTETDEKAVDMVIRGLKH